MDFASLTTLVKENVFAEMREENDMTLVMQFAHRFVVNFTRKPEVKHEE